MPDTLLYILIGIGALIVLLLVAAAMRPPQFRIERGIEIAAAPERAFDQVNDFHAWRAWSPWEGIDPNLQRTYEGPAAGVGAAYGWTGNNKVGQGRMTIGRSERASLI